jgi:hypothetical protein
MRSNLISASASVSPTNLVGQEKNRHEPTPSLDAAIGAVADTVEAVPFETSRLGRSACAFVAAIVTVNRAASIAPIDALRIG